MSVRGIFKIVSLPVQASVQQVFTGQRPEETPVRSISSKSLRQHRAGGVSCLAALSAHLDQLPGPPEPLGHVGAGVGHPLVAAVPAEAQRHVGVHVERFGRRGVQLDDGRQAVPAGGRSHVQLEALQIQTSAEPTRYLDMLELHLIRSSGFLMRAFVTVTFKK